MIKTRKICIVSAGRADYIRIKSALYEINKRKDLELQLVIVGAHLLDRFGYTVKNVEKDGFKINDRVHMMLEGNDPLIMTKSIGLGIIELSTILNKLKPDIVMALTDRFEALVTSVSAATMNIPLIHLQGGEVTGTIDESIRHACTKFANWHFASTEESKKRIIKLGEKKETVFNTGCPSIDLLKKIKITSKEQILKNLEKFSNTGFKIETNKDFLLVLQHPVTTEYEDSYDNILQTLKAVYKTGLNTVMLWPNIDSGNIEMVKSIRKFLYDHPDNKIYMFKHFPYDVFVNLMFHCSCMVGNSSASIRETPSLGTPVVDIGTRELGRERGINTISADYNSDSIYSAIIKQVNKGKFDKQDLFGDGKSGKIIAKLISEIDLSYVQKKIVY